MGLNVRAHDEIKGCGGKFARPRRSFSIEFLSFVIRYSKNA